MPNVAVTLHVRVWIEILRFCTYSSCNAVTLHVRVWIEMSTTYFYMMI